MLAQLSYAGMMEPVRIRRSGYPVRYRLEDFHKPVFLTSSGDLKKLQSFNQLLELFHAATKQLEGDHLTMPLVPAVLSDLKQQLKEAAADKDLVTRSSIAQLFLQSFNNRFGDIFSEVNLALQAAALHPQFGHLPWISDELRNAVWRSLKKLGNSLQSDDEQARSR